MNLLYKNQTITNPKCNLTIRTLGASSASWGLLSAREEEKLISGNKPPLHH